jgi:hypothetical protein
MALLVGAAGLPADTVRVLAAWKEVAVVVLLLAVLSRALLTRGPGAVIATPDLAITCFIALCTLFLVTENAVFGADIPQVAALLGFREAVFFLLLYYVGRGSPDLARGAWVLRNLFAMAILVSLIGVAERLFVSPEMLVLVGVATYLNDFLGLSAFTAGTDWGLPQNYWTLIGDTAVRRAGSVFLHSQGFALPFLLLMPAATAFVLHRRNRAGMLLRIGYAILWIGLLLTVTRMTIVVCLVQVALFYVMVRKPEWAAGTLVAWVAAFAVAMALLPALARFAWETLTWQTGSSVSHVDEWTKGIVAFLEKPWGHGLGTTEHIAVRSGMTPITGDNMFLSYAVQFGLGGLAVHLTILMLILAYAWRAFRSAADPDVSRFGAVLALTTLGILLNGATSIVFSSTFLAYVYFLLAGALVTNSPGARLASLRTV